MSIEKNDQDSFILVWVGNQSPNSISGIKFTNEFTNYDELKEFLIDKDDSSVIVILSNSISIDTISLVASPQICAIYDEKVICLYCLPRMVPSVDMYMKNKQEEEELKESSCSSYLFPILQKYWFLIGLIFAISFAYLFPNVGKTGGYIRSEWSVKWGCVIIIFFLSGLSLRTRQLAKEFLRIRLHVLIQIYSLVIIPFTVYGLSLLLIRTSMNKTLIVGIVVMASTSTTISSNVVMTKNAMGNEYVALLNAILGNILGIFVSPALIFYFLKNPIFDSLSNTNNTEGQLDYSHVIRNLTLTVLIPLFIGQIIHLIWTKKVTYIREKFYFTELNSLALLTLVWSVFCTAFATGSFKTIQTKDLLILICIDAGIYIIFSLLIMIIARLPIRHWQFEEKDTVAIMFCGATKTLAMGIPLINALYGNKSQEISGLISLPLIMYHVEQLIMGAIEVILLRKWVQKGLKKEASTSKDNVNTRLNNDEQLETPESQTISVKC